MYDRCTTATTAMTVRQYDSYDSCTTVITCVSCHTLLRQLRQLRQGYDRCTTATTAPLQGWLNLIGMPLVEVHPSRKVSIDKCSHQGSAHWQQSLVRCAPGRGTYCNCMCVRTDVLISCKDDGIGSCMIRRTHPK